MSRPDKSPRVNGVTARPGFTLAEGLLASMILAIVSASAVLPFLAGSQQVSAAAELEQATAYGQALMEEILARPFSDPDGSPAVAGPETGESSRNLFDNIDDFHGYTESAVSIRNFQNAAITAPSATGLWRSVTVQYVTFPGLAQQAGDVNSLARIEVRVYRGTALLVTLDRIVARED